MWWTDCATAEPIISKERRQEFDVLLPLSLARPSPRAFSAISLQIKIEITQKMMTWWREKSPVVMAAEITVAQPFHHFGIGGNPYFFRPLKKNMNIHELGPYTAKLTKNWI